MKSIRITGFSSFSFFLFFSLNIYGQEAGKFNLTAGLGYPEAINVGVRYQMEQSQLGIFIGAFPGSDPSVFSAGQTIIIISGDRLLFPAENPGMEKLV